jgi:hypothetical protein
MDLLKTWTSLETIKQKNSQKVNSQDPLLAHAAVPIDPEYQSGQGRDVKLMLLERSATRSRRRHHSSSFS